MLAPCLTCKIHFAQKASYMCISLIIIAHMYIVYYTCCKRTYNVILAVATHMIILRAAMSGLKALQWNPSWQSVWFQSISVLIGWYVSLCALKVPSTDEDIEVWLADVLSIYRYVFVYLSYVSLFTAVIQMIHGVAWCIIMVDYANKFVEFGS